MLAVLLLRPCSGLVRQAGPPRTRACHIQQAGGLDPVQALRPAAIGQARLAPFPLLSYKDAAKRANFLKEITSSRRMPPWKPVHGFGEFQDERRLSDEEIKIIARWADSGAKEGDSKDLPPPPKFQEGWQLGKPDLVLKMTEPFTIPAGEKEIYRCFVIPSGLKESRTVAAIEFRPGNPRVVHHARIYLDTSGAARKKEKKDSLPGFASPGGTVGVQITGILGGWVPGTTPRRLPEGMGRRMAKGSDLLMQIHYKPSGKEEKDQSTVGIFFNKKPPGKIVRGLSLVELRLHIPAGEKRYRRTASYKVPVDLHVIGITPHITCWAAR